MIKFLIIAALILMVINIAATVFLYKELTDIKFVTAASGNMTIDNYKNIRELLTSVLLSMREDFISEERYEDVTRIDKMLKETARGTFWDKERRDRELNNG